MLECEFVYQYALKLHREKEQQQRIKDQMGEERHALRDFERAVAKAQKEEAASCWLKYPPAKSSRPRDAPGAGLFGRRSFPNDGIHARADARCRGDHASALVCLHFALALDFLAVPVGNFRAGWPPGHETHSIAPHAFGGSSSYLDHEHPTFPR